MGREGCGVIQWVFMQKAVISLQKVIVSPVTLLGEIPVHNQCVPVRKKTRSPQLKILGPLCNQTVNLETDAKPFHYS